jgi:predicted oxidoreductase
LSPRPAQVPSGRTSNESANDHFRVTVWSIPDTAGGGTGKDGDAVTRAWPAEHAAATPTVVTSTTSRDVARQIPMTECKPRITVSYVLIEGM